MSRGAVTPVLSMLGVWSMCQARTPQDGCSGNAEISCVTSAICRRKRYELTSKPINYGSDVRGNMRLVLKVLSPSHFKDLQSDISGDIKKVAAPETNGVVGFSKPRPGDVKPPKRRYIPYRYSYVTLNVHLVFCLYSISGRVLCVEF